MSQIDDLANDPEYFSRLAKSGRTPDAIDLLALQLRISTLTKKEADIERRSLLIPGNKRALEEVRAELRQLYILETSVKEHVWSHREQSKIYDNQKRLRAEAAQQREAEDRTASPTTEVKRASLREYIDRVKKERQTKPGEVREPETERER